MVEPMLIKVILVTRRCTLAKVIHNSDLDNKNIN